MAKKIKIATVGMFSSFTLKTLLIFFCLLIFEGSLQAPSSLGNELERKEEMVNFESKTITGDWNGSRTRLFEQGVHLELEYFGDMFSIVSGGLSQETDYSGLLEIKLHLDGEKFFGWQGSQFFIFGIGTHGKDFKENVGSVHDVSNLVAPDTFNFFEFWYEQSFLEDRFSVLFGLYDLNSEFDVRPTAQLFINGTFGIGLDISQSGQNGPSIFPTTSLATRIRIQPVPRFYYLGAILDGVPGDPNNPNGTRLDLDDDDGLLLTQEIGYEPQTVEIGLNKTGLGGWLYTTDLDDLSQVDVNGNPVKHSGTYGIYFFVDAALYLENSSNSRGLFSFFRIGIAEAETNKVDFYLDSGLVYRGLFPERPDDQIGLGVSLARFSDGFKEKQKQDQVLIEDTEVLLELTYKYEMGPGFSLQPDFQYLFNPALAKGADNAISIGFRLALEF